MYPNRKDPQQTGREEGSWAEKLVGRWMLILGVLLDLEGTVGSRQGAALRETRKGERRCEYPVSSVMTGTMAHLVSLNPHAWPRAGA